MINSFYKIIIKISIIIWLLIFLCLLSACAKKEPSTAIAENIKSDITVIEHQIQDVKDNLPKECQNPSVKANLSVIQENIKNIKGKVDSQVIACDTQNAVLQQENSKLKWIIGFLLTIGCLLLYLLTIKRKIL